MEKTLDVFKSQQAKNLEILTNLNAFLLQGEAFGIQMDPHLLHKLEMAKRTLPTANFTLR